MAGGMGVKPLLALRSKGALGFSTQGGKKKTPGFSRVSQGKVAASRPPSPHSACREPRDSPSFGSKTAGSEESRSEILASK